MRTKMIGIKGVVDDNDVIKINEDLDKAEELVDKYNIYIDEAQSVVNGTLTLNEVLSKHNNGKTLNEGEGEHMAKLNEDIGKLIKTVEWEGHTIKFYNSFHNTGTKSHDVLTMKIDDYNTYTGETTWINRPWHRFDLEEAFDEIVSKTFGQKALALIQEIDKDAHSVEDAIDKFFAQFKSEDIQANDKLVVDDSVEGRKNALAKELEIDSSELEETDENTFAYEDAEYRVLTDEEADYEFDERIRSLWDDMGLELVGDGWMKDWIFENALDDDEFEDFVREDINNQVYDMDDEEVADECINEGIVDSEDVYNEESDEYSPELRDDVDFDDLREQLIDYKVDEIINEQTFGSYLQDLGYEEDYIKQYIDEEKVIEALKDDATTNGTGRGQELAYYDGEEIELDGGLFAYRIN